MYKLYIISNLKSESVYFGITSSSLKRRWASHKHIALTSKTKTKLADAMRSYGIENFTMELLYDYEVESECLDAEISLIANYPGKTYNLAIGGQTGFSMRRKTLEEQVLWKENLRVGRQGRKPSLGMKHTEANKAKFSEFGKQRWDLYGRYPQEVLELGFTKSNKKYGISKTHYYRMRLAANACK